MTTEDKLNITPEVDKVKQPVTPSKGKVEPIVPSQELPEKYKGKTAVEIAEMHANAERKISELGSKNTTLNTQLLASQVQALPTKPSEKGVLSEQDAYYNEPFSYTKKEIDSLKKQNQQLAVGMTVLMARQDKSMPDWEKYEQEILSTVNEKPYLFDDPNWSKVAYDLVMSTKKTEQPKVVKKEKIMESVPEAEPVAKVADEAHTTAADAELKAPPLPAPIAPKDAHADKLALAKSGKINWQEYLQDTLSDAELQVEKGDK